MTNKTETLINILFSLFYAQNTSADLQPICSTFKLEVINRHRNDEHYLTLTAAAPPIARQLT